MVEFIDGSIKAQLSMPDMKLPIQFALSYPERIAGNYVETNFIKIGELTFREPDLQKFQCLKLAYSAMEEAGTAPCILNAANEVAVNKFLNGKIKFKQIPEYINKALDKIENHRAIDMETIVESDRQTREYVNNL
jgi:1-deoxy-D-xylulose-5-phosphate reductoisomerase